MQRTCTAEESLQSKSSISTHKVSHSGGGGAWTGWAHPSSYDFFRTPFSHPATKTNAPLIAPHPPHLKNKPPPLKRETTFHEMIPWKKHNK